MIAYIVNIDRLLFSVFLSCKNTSNICLSFCSRSKRCRIRKNSFQKLKRYDFFSFVHNRLNGCHSYIFQTFQMCQIALSKCHKETDSFDSRNIQCQRFDFFMVQKIHIFHSHFRKIVFSLDLHRLCLYPVSVFPVRTFCRNLADVDLRIEVRCKRIAVISSIAVQNIDIINLVKIMFQRICRKYSCYSGIKSTSQQRRNSCFFKFLTVCPLPFIFEFCSIFRLIICSVYIIHSCRKAGIHNCKILIWKCQIQYYVRFFPFDQCNQFFWVICIHLCSCNRSVVGSLQFFFQCLTF